MGKKNTGMMDWFKGSDALNLVAMARHTKTDADGNDISHQHCSICDADFEDDISYNDHMMTHENDRIAEENRVAEEQNAMIEENNRVLAQQQQEIMEETANDVAYTPEDAKDWNQEITQESYDESVAPIVNPVEINQEYSDPYSEKSVAFDSSVDNTTLGVMDVVNTTAEETPVDSTYYQNLAPTDSTILPSSENVSDVQSSPNPSYDVMGNPIDEMGNPLDYESGYTTEGGNQEFPGKQPIGDNSSREEETKPKSPPDVDKKDITTIFQKDDRVYYRGKIYVVQGTDENGLVVAICADGSIINVSQDVLKSETMVASEYTPGEWEAAEKNSQPKNETQTETETAQEESPPDKTVIEPPVLIYFEALDMGSPASAIMTGSPFVVRWKVDNKNGKVILQCPDGTERVGNEAKIPQQMGDVAMNYSLLALDKENNVIAPSPWVLAVESLDKDKIETPAKLIVSSDNKEVKWKIDNFDLNMGFRIQVISNGVVISEKIIDRKEGVMAI